MKKILFLLPFLLTFAHADTQTTGNLKLLQPTTGQAFDPNDASKRSWGDKFNKNFQIIDSSLTTAMDQIGNPAGVSIYDESGTFQGNATTIKVNNNLTVSMTGSTATINGSAGGGGGGSGGALYTGAATISVSTFSFPGATITSVGGASTITYMPAIASTNTAFQTHASTAQTAIHLVRLATGTAQTLAFTAINSTDTASKVHSSTAQTAIHLVRLATGTLQTLVYTAINSTDTASKVHSSTAQLRVRELSVATNAVVTNLSLWLSTTQAVIKSTAANLADDAGTINTEGNPVHWGKLYGVPAGIADGTDAEGAGGDGTSLRMADVVIGTAGALGVDYASNNFRDSMNQALSDKGASLTSTNTVPLNIFVRQGVYDATDSSVPARVYLYTVPNPSGTIFVVNDTSKTIISNYGIVDGFTFDGGSRPFIAGLIEMKSNSILRNNTFIGMQAMANYNRGSAIVSVANSSNTRIHNNWFKEYHGCAGILFQGQCGAIKVIDSTESYTYNNFFSSPAYFASKYETIWSNVRTIGAYFEGNEFEGTNGIAVSIGTGRNIIVDRNKFYLGAGSQGDANDYGTITLDGSDEPIATGSSSMTVISNNWFIFKSSAGGAPGGNIIYSRGLPTPPRNGVIIKGNVVTSPVRTNWAFYRSKGVSDFNTVIKDNDIQNLESFIPQADLLGLKFKDLGNTFNGLPIVTTGPINALNFGISNSTGLEIGRTQMTTYMSTVSAEIDQIASFSASSAAALSISTANTENSLAQRTVVGYDNGSPLSGGHIQALNFAGSDFGASQSGGTVTVTIDAKTVVGYDDGTPLTGGHVQAIDFVGAGVGASQAGGTVTVTISGGAGGSGGGAGAVYDGSQTQTVTTFTVTNADVRFNDGFASITVRVPTFYDLVIGTPGTPGVDVYVSSTSNFNLALSSRGLNGITSVSSITATYLMKSGVYNMHGSTIPAGLTIVTGSSVVWVTDNSSETLTTIYGKVDGVKFDMQNSSVSSRYIELKSSSSLTNFELYNQQWGQRTSGASAYTYSTLYANKAVNFKVQGTVHGTRWIRTEGQYGDNANFMVFDSSDSEISINVHSSTQNSTSSVFFVAVRSRNIRWTDSNLQDVGGDFIVLETGTKDFKFERNRVLLSRPPGDEGFITLQSQVSNGVGMSSMTLINNNYFELTNNASPGRIVRVSGNGGTFLVPGLRVTNNTVSRQAGTNIPSQVLLVSLTARAANAVIMGNIVDGCAAIIQDNGMQTVAQGNFLNGEPIAVIGGFTIGGGNRSLGNASLSVGSTTVNLPLLNVSSDNVKFQVTGTSSSFFNDVTFSSPIVTVSTFTSSSSGTFTTLTASSFTIAGGTFVVGGTSMIFPSSAPPAGVDLTLHWRDGMAYFGGDAVGAGGGEVTAINSTNTAFQNHGSTAQVKLQSVQLATGTLASTFSTFITTANDVFRSTMSELADNTNTINALTNLVSWNSLKDVPAGFSDGTDDGAGGASAAPPGLSVGTGSFVASQAASSPTAAIVFSSAGFITMANGTTNFIRGIMEHTLYPEIAQFRPTNFPAINVSTFLTMPESGLLFDAALSETAFWKVNANKFHQGISSLTVTILWRADTPATTSGDVQWGVQIATITPNVDVDDTLVTFFTSTRTVIDTHLGTRARRLHSVSVGFGPSDLAGLDHTGYMGIAIHRNGNNVADTLVGDVQLLYATVEY